MKKAKSSSVSTLIVENPQSELKESSKSDEKLERLLKQIALLPCPEETGGMETEGHEMGGPPLADAVLKLVARGLLWVSKLEVKSGCGARMESKLDELEEEGSDDPLPCPDDCGSCGLDG